MSCLAYTAFGLCATPHPLPKKSAIRRFEAPTEAPAESKKSVQRRQDIVNVIRAMGQAKVSQIALQLKVDTSTISHHLRVLEDRLIVRRVNPGQSPNVWELA
ncbi:winged helix-turn-helix domain-containing protein [Uliginosibacterium sp. sgz301328]|uniref:helix-turn-helix domain-containing protein n=1 Tax=Uliginosibacterium sp. sgz301328 TaxID=3243764 RepID=UPI00359DCA1E